MTKYPNLCFPVIKKYVTDKYNKVSDGGSKAYKFA
jgi:hypothetical protein